MNNQDVSYAEELVAQSDVSMSPTIGDLAGALALAQASGMMATLDKESHRNKYASLGSVLDAAKAAFDNGLALIQLPSVRDGRVYLESILAHSSGQWIRSVLYAPIPAQKGMQDVQAMGSTVSYLRRYAASSILGIATGDDNDGNSEAEPRGQYRPQYQNSRPREVTTRPRTMPSHRAEQTRHNHPATMEVDAPRTGQAPPTPPPGEVVPVRKSKDPNAHYHATCEELGFSKDERRWLLGYSTTKEASDQEKDDLAYALKEWVEQEIEAARTFVNSESLDDLRANWGKLSARQQAVLFNSKDYLKQVLSEVAA